MDKKEKSLQLLTAKEALEITKSQYTDEVQLQQVTEEINKRLEYRSGVTHAFIGGSKKLYKETINSLLNKGYDLYMSYSEESSSWDNIVYWDEKASGKIREKAYSSEEDDE